MKITILIFSAFIIAVILGILPICHAETPDARTSAEDIKKETQDLLKALNSYTADQKDEAVNKTKDALDSLDKRIDEMEAMIDKGWDKMDRAAREKARESLKALRNQRKKVAEWYDRLKSSSGDSWEIIKKGFSDAYKALNDAWNKLKNELGYENDKPYERI